jgi:hypothetical protein
MNHEQHHPVATFGLMIDYFGELQPPLNPDSRLHSA